MTTRNFIPAFRHGPGILVAATTSSGSTAVDLGFATDWVRVTNSSTTITCYLAFSPSNTLTAAAPTSTAAVNNIVVLPLADMLIPVSQARYFAALAASSTASVFVHAVNI